MAKTALALAALLVGHAAQAADKNGNYHIVGAGTLPCQKYLDANEAQRTYAETWWAGYVSAMNRTTSDTWSLVGTGAADKVNAAIGDECKAFPNELFAVAVQKVLQKIAETSRVAVGPGK